MSRSLSIAAKSSINDHSTDEIWLVLLKLEHDDWSSPIRLVRNTEAVTSNGDEYVPFPFEANLPDEEAEQVSVINWSALNASNELMDELRSVTGPIDGEIFWVLASDPDDVQIGPMTLQIRVFEYDAQVIKGTMVVEPIMDAVFGYKAMDNTNAPGLF